MKSTTQQGSRQTIFKQINTYNYGMKRENPCDQFWFYTKDEPDKPIRIKREEISHMLPETFEVRHLILYFNVLLA